MKKTLLLISIILSLIFMAGCERGNGDVEGDEDTPSITIRLTSDISETHASGVAALEVFKPRVEELSGGKIQVEVYLNSALGSVPENIESMRIGDLEMCWATDGSIAGAVPEWNVVGIPFMFTSVDAAHNALDGDFGKALDRILEEKTGIINLGNADVGFRNITNSKKTIRTPEDLQGIKIRTMTSTLHVEYFTALGAVPTPMSFSELFTALQQKTVDAQENPTAITWNNKLYEVQNYMTISEHVWTCAPLLIAKDFYEGLPEDYQKIIAQASWETVEYQRDLITQQNEDLVANIEGAGLEVITLTAEEKAVFQKVAEETVYKTAATDYGQDLIDLALKYNE